MVALSIRSAARAAGRRLIESISYAAGHKGFAGAPAAG
jgi:hypothetical protein